MRILPFLAGKSTTAGIASRQVRIKRKVVVVSHRIQKIIGIRHRVYMVATITFGQLDRLNIC